MRINGIEVVGEFFAYDGCHKIYLIENKEDEKQALEGEYEILPIDELEETYEDSCELKFISNWSLDKKYVGQFEDACFEYYWM